MVVTIHLVFKERLETHEELAVRCEDDETFRSACHRAISEKELRWSYFAVMPVTGTSYIDITTVVSPSNNDSRFYVQQVIANADFLEKLPGNEVPMALFFTPDEYGWRLQAGFYPAYKSMTDEGQHYEYGVRNVWLHSPLPVLEQGGNA